MLGFAACAGEEAPSDKPKDPGLPPVAGVDMTKPLVGSPEEEARMDAMVLIPYLQDSLWGYVDTTGKMVIPPRYKWVEVFSEGNLTIVQAASGFGLLNKLGREVVAPVHDEKIAILGCGMYAFREGGHWAILNSTPRRIDQGKVTDFQLFACDDGLLPVKWDGAWRYIDNEGALLPGPGFEEAMSYNHGVAPVKPHGEDLWTVVDKQGKRITNQAFKQIFPFTEGLGVGIQDNAVGKNKYGVIDTAGNVVIPFQFGRIGGTFTGGYVAAAAYDPYDLQSKGIGNEANTWFIYNRKGEKVGETHYDVWDSFSEGLVVIERNEKFGFADTTGKVVIPLKYDWACAFKSGLAFVCRKDRCGYIDRQGREVIPLKYEAVYDYQFMDENGSEFRDPVTGERFYIDKNGREMRN